MDVEWSVAVIGETSGKVWQHLQKNGASTLSALEKGVKAPASAVHMALGWLAREGKIAIAQEKRSVKVSLTGY
jgi:hypothetical protein